MKQRIFVFFILLIAAVFLSGCSSMSPEIKESLGDLRGSLPKSLRGDAKPLESYPLPKLTGQWIDTDFPEEIKVQLKQTGNVLTISRKGARGEVVVRNKVQAQLEGRAIKAIITNNDPNLLRPLKGECSGSVSKNQKRISLSCRGGHSFGMRSYPLNFSKK